MSQESLFAVGPYVALALALLGMLIRLALPLEPATRTRQLHRIRLLLWSTAAWKVGVLALVGGHLLPVLLPHGLLSWNDDSLRLLILEGVGFGFGGLAFAGLWIGIRRSRNEGLPFGMADTILATALLFAVGSGLLLAMLHRWGSTWSVTVLVPYVQSLVSLTPRGELMAGLPFLARLHVLSALALVALAPFSSLGVIFSRPAPRVSAARS